MKQYGQIIAQLRKRNNLTQAELGKKLSVSYQAVSKWENNQSQPDLDTIQLMAKVFGISVAEFLDDVQSATKTASPTLQNYPSKNKIWYLISALAASILVMILVVTIVPIKLSIDRIYSRVDPAVFCVTMEKENGDQMAGTGFFINEQGLAVTNYHVIENCVRGEIKLNNGETYQITKVVGCDEKRDIAIIQIDIKHNPKVTLGDSNQIKVGETVYAIGYPESLTLGNDNSTLTQGIISKASYTYEENTYIQTTVNITHGNSGGVLLNEQGKVIGITTAMLTDGTVDYMNMAIPINALKDVKRNFDYSLTEYKEQHVKFYYYSNNSVYQELDIMKGNTVKRINAPSAKTGYKFAGWYKDKTFNEEFDFFLPINEVAYCYAKWTPISYTIRFVADAVGEMPDQIFYYNETQALNPNLFIKKGYQFVGWIRKFTDGRDSVSYADQYRIANLTTKDGEIIELTAEFQIINYYTITFDANSGTGKMTTQTSTYGEQVRLNPNQLTRIGYHFAGWEYAGKIFPDKELIDNIILQEAKITLKAVWEPITYTLVFYRNADTMTADTERMTVKYDEEFSLPQDIFGNTGYHVTYWQNINTQRSYAASSQQSNWTTIDGQVFYLTPTWEINQYQVKLYYGNSWLNYKIIDCQWDVPFALEIGSANIPRGYHVSAYRLADGTELIPNAEGLCVNLSTKHGDQIKVYSNFEINHYCVYLRQEATNRYSLLGNFAYDEKFVLPAASPKEHYTQIGWCDEIYSSRPVYPVNQAISGLTTTNGDNIFLKPQWLGDNYTIIYDGNGAESGAMPNQIAILNETFNLNANQFVKEGYLLKGWLYEGEVYGETFKLTTYHETITLIAVWIGGFAGSGTEDDPYLIETTTDFYKLADLVKLSKNYRDVCYRLDNDLDFNYEAVTIEEFRGVFDGNGHIIKNVTYAMGRARGLPSYGLFTYCFGGTIKNLGVENYQLNDVDVWYVGGLVANSYDSTLLNCYAVGTITCVNEDLPYVLGGLVGYASAANSYSYITDCYAELNLTLISDKGRRSSICLGGLIGQMYYTNVTGCYAITNFDVELTDVKVAETGIAGLIGSASSMVSFTNCFAVVDMSIKLTNDESGFRINNFVNSYFVEGQNCYVLTKAFDWSLNGESQPNDDTTATPVTDVSNLQDATWLQTNVFTDSTAWAYHAGEYPKLKIFEE